MNPLPKIRYASRPPVLLAVLVLSLMTLPAFAQDARSGGKEGLARELETNMTAKGFLDFVNRSDEKALRAHPGFDAAVVGKILSWRGAKRSFGSLGEFRKETGIRSVDFEEALRPFHEKDQRVSSLDASRKPIPDPAPAKPGASATDDPRAAKLRSRQANTPEPATPADAPPAGGDEDGPIGSVRPGFYGNLPGYEKWDGIDPLVRKEFFETVNRELCTCGCANETLAFCYVNDPGCPVVRARVKKIHEDLVRQDRGARTAPSEPDPQR